MNYLIGIDLGTSSTKTVLFDEVGNIIADSKIDYPMYTPHNGWAEQEPDDWANAAVNTIANVIKDSGVNKDDIKGIGISGQMHGLVMLDEDGKVIRPSIIWCDQRTGKECDEITEKVGAERLIEITANPALTGFTASKILWVKNNEPENYAKCKHILLPKDYVRYVLTGEFATEVSDASGMQLLDVPKRQWSDEVLEKLDIDKSMLAKVYESCEVTGTITEEAAAKTGLSTSTVVVGGAGDNAAAAVGTGVVEEGMAFTTIGTSGVVFAHSKEVKIDPKGRVHTFCCAVPGEWHQMGVTQACGYSLQWYLDNCGNSYAYDAEKTGEGIYDIIDREVLDTPIGSNKLIYLPYLNGERTPHLDPDCRGVFFGLSSMHKRSDMVRAVYEGMIYSLTDCKDVLDEMGVPINEMMACGGGLKSVVKRQMLSDSFGVDVNTVTAKEGPALGVAILAGVGAGLYESVQEACKKMIHKDPDNACTPNMDNNKEYDKYHAIYKKLYDDLKDSFKDMAKL
ncbi:MAG: xylulokinase [Lachnospiraceae bacterium]|nr:xylulokinase [Lachnospiraceae bacterium]